jgi:endonuclease/exonuclease/phosphatase family metal-dependent hydrolase
VVKNIVAKILEKDRDSRVVVLGDMNEPKKQLVHHLNVVGDRHNHLVPARLVGSWWTHFPKGGMLSAIDNILVTGDTQRLFRAGRVLRCYAASDHRPLVMTPYANLMEMVWEVKLVRPAFDSQMMYLKGDLLGPS